MTVILALSVITINQHALLRRVFLNKENNLDYEIVKKHA